jgi:hypothetical protein
MSGKSLTVSVCARRTGLDRTGEEASSSQRATAGNAGGNAAVTVLAYRQRRED